MAKNAAYRDAEKKIQKALLTGAKHLSLRGRRVPDLRLSELPGALVQLTQLESLDLSSNQLFELPESLGQLTQLQSLNLRDNKLTALPKFLGQFWQLQTLEFAGNPLRELPEWLGKFTQLKSLNLGSKHLTELPEWLAELTQLHSLDLSGNHLRELPEWLGRLTQLRSLDLSEMNLRELPEWLVQLTLLQSLSLARNGLGELPEWLGQLTQLEDLQVWGNSLTTLPPSLSLLVNLRRISFSWNSIDYFPDWLCRLPRLVEVYALDNMIDQLPEGIGNLKSLRRLILGGKKISWHVMFGGKDRGNKLESLPSSLADLDNLKELNLSGNPLSPSLATAYEQGAEGVKRYLREMAKGGRNRYEAKLLILGDGNEGKTCVSRALRGLAFEVQKSTLGVDVEQWKFPHPEKPANPEKEVTLNIWDFEGQEISHQTHQFFLTSQALYLLVFKCRDQFLMDRAEYWLDTIRARAPKAKVAIVISQCELRSPHIPMDKIAAQYSDMLAEEWFFPVGCENAKNIEKLQTFLQHSAVNLDFMGTPWPQSYEIAETEIKEVADTDTPHLTRASLNSILQKSGVNGDNYDGAAGEMARIGAITQFPDSPDLSDFVVLKPQWLTKAISKLMEDGQLSEDKGEIAMKRMEEIWNQEGHCGMFATFHNCMKEFELCYDLEAIGRCCLVPLRFGYLAPEIPWTVTPGLKERRMEYKLNIRPPMGIMSRFIVKTHHMIVKNQDHPKGVYWHNGVFLRTMSPVPSEALCEFVPDERIFRVRVRAAFPQNMCEQVNAYIQAVFSFFGGLSAERSYGCIKVDTQTDSETQCVGLHTEKRIYTAIARQRETLDCEFEDHEVDPNLLVLNMSSFGDFVAEKITAAQIRAVVQEEIGKTHEWAERFFHGLPALVNWVGVNSGKLDQVLRKQEELSEEFKQESELKLHEYLRCMSDLLDDRDHTAVPALISISKLDGSPWNPEGYFKQTYLLTPYCECEGNIHPCEDGSVEFKKNKKWWAASAPWIARGTKILAAGLKIAYAGMPLALGGEVAKSIEDQVKLMEALTEYLDLEMPEEKGDDGSTASLSGGIGKDLRGNSAETARTRAALARMLEGIAPDSYRARRWGSLKRVQRSDNTYRWLCEACAHRSG